LVVGVRQILQIWEKKIGIRFGEKLANTVKQRVSEFLIHVVGMRGLVDAG
jgi:hypothetical protein